MQRLGKGSSHCHRLSDALHGCGERWVGTGKLFEGETWHLDHDVVKGRLETSGGNPGYVIGYFIERVAQRELGGNLGNREAGCLRGQCG